MMNRNAERMKYQKDKLSYMLCILSIIFNAMYFVSIYRNRDIVPDVYIGSDILINIIFMMVAFMASEKLKVYSKKWNIYIFIVGILQFTRIFLVPVHFEQLEMLSGNLYTFVVACIIISSILLLAAGVNATINSRILSSKDDSQQVGG